MSLDKAKQLGAALVATAAPLFPDDLGILPRTPAGLVAWLPWVKLENRTR